MRMTEKEKKEVPKSERGVPGKSGTGSYPMPDQNHARAAIGLAAMHHGANSSFVSKIKAKAHKLGYGHESTHHGDGHHASTHHGGAQTMHVHLHMGGKKKFSI